MTRTYYDVLGVTRDADAERVRAAYRERVKEVHPDVSDRPDAAERFRTLSSAREVLCDPDERARYDRLGHEAYTGESTPASDGTPDAEAGEGNGAEASESDGGRDRHDDDQRKTAGERTRNRRRRRRRRADAWATAGDHFVGDDGEWGRATADASGQTTGATANSATASATGTEYVGPDESSWYRTGAGDATGYRVSTRTDSAVEFTAERGLLAAAVFICYPMLLGVAVLPVFGWVIRVAAAVCALLVVAQTLSIPESGVLVFGALTLVAPLGLNLVGIDVLSPEAVLAWAFCWIPFVIAVGNFLALRA